MLSPLPKALSWPISWTLYLAGDLIWRAFDQWSPWGMSRPIYGAYNWLMLTSHRVQGPGGRGPWDTVEARVPGHV